jgi:prephenate dehydrogenase
VPGQTIRNAIILGGSGQAGSLLTHSLARHEIAITTVDLSPPAVSAGEHRYLRADVTSFGRELEQVVHNSDCVCLCLPEQIALDSAPRIAAAMQDGALWVDTLSVKGPITTALKAQSTRLEILSINPMFAPALGWPGRPVAVVEQEHPGPKAQFFKDLLTAWGASIEIVSSEQHDRLTAALQAATHAAALAFGSALLSLNYDVKAALRLATPPHRILLGLLYRIACQNAEVYWDIQAYHPHATEARQQLRKGLDTIEALTKKGDLDGFKIMFQEIGALLGPSDRELQGLTQDLIAATQRPR